MRQPEQTRAKILKAALEEMHRHGFQGASLNTIVEKAQITKGALFHHFVSKKELGYAVVDELLHESSQSMWSESFEQSDNPIDCLQKSLRQLLKKTKSNPCCMECGCPLNNLAQEMSPLDEGFRQRIEKVFDSWRSMIAAALETGKKRGYVAKGVKTRAVASFFVASFEGTVGTMKNARDPRLFEDCVETMIAYLETLRA